MRSLQATTIADRMRPEVVRVSSAVAPVELAVAAISQLRMPLRRRLKLNLPLQDARLRRRCLCLGNMSGALQ